MATDDVRAFLDDLITEQRTSYSDLSRLIGRNPAYIQQFIKRGTPRRLGEQDRRTIARFFGVPEHLLSSPASPDAQPEPIRRSAQAVAIKRMTLGVSAGTGALDIDDQRYTTVMMDSRWLRTIGVQPLEASLSRVEGESMAPTLFHGDEILVNHGDDMARLRDGIYVLRLDDALLVKRVAMGLQRGQFSILSDNVLYPSWRDIDPQHVSIIGRVVWKGQPVL